MTAFMYQIRLKAWRDGQNYRKFPRAVVDAEVVCPGAPLTSAGSPDAVGVL